MGRRQKKSEVWSFLNQKRPRSPFGLKKKDFFPCIETLTKFPSVAKKSFLISWFSFWDIIWHEVNRWWAFFLSTIEVLRDPWTIDLTQVDQKSLLWFSFGIAWQKNHSFITRSKLNKCLAFFPWMKRTNLMSFFDHSRFHWGHCDTWGIQNV